MTRHNRGVGITCENSIRPFCLGRRGRLFADTVDGANASANLYHWSRPAYAASGIGTIMPKSGLCRIECHRRG